MIHVGAAARPPVTIILSTHGRPDFLRDCVAHLLDAMRAGDELLVIECCNPSAATQLAGLPASLTHLSRHHEAKSEKLNAGLRRARHDVVLLTDDDCRVPRDWIDALSAPFANPAVGVAFGPVRGLSSLPGSSGPPPVPVGPAPPEFWNYTHGASMAIRRTALREIGGFDERLGPGSPCLDGEEADVVLRAAAHGWLCEIAGGAPVEHLDWRDGAANHENLLGYQRGSGAYIGAALRRDPRRAAKTLVLRLMYEFGVWRDERSSRGARFSARMTGAFVMGMWRGLRFEPRRYLEPDASRAATARSRRPRVLWVTDEPPDRNRGGGNIRQAAMLGILANEVDVTLLLAGTLSDAAVRERLAGVIEVAPPRPRTGPGSLGRRVRDLIRALLARHPADVLESARVRRSLLPVLRRLEPEFDVVIVQHMTLAPLIAVRRSAHWMLEVHNVPSERARQEAERQSGARQRWLLRREGAHARRYQREVVKAYDRVITISRDDAAALTGGTHPFAERFVVVPNGVHLDRQPVEVPDAPNILLPASLDYRPNVLGAIWFCHEVFPRVRARIPDARFALAGRDPVPEIVALGEQPGVEVHGRVPRMQPWLDWARVVVVPLHIGSGTRLKALEAMAAGRPLVGTTIGLEGLELVDGAHARIIDDAEAMADAIVEIVESREQAERLAAQGRRHAERSFGWEHVARPLVEYLSGLSSETSADVDVSELEARSAVS